MTPVEGFLAVPLTSEYDLFQESLKMHHCVVGYGRICTEGYSRIFTLSKEGKPAATTQLRFAEGRWQPVQTRSYYNGDPPPGADHAARALADAYNEAQEVPKTCWYVNLATGQTLTELPEATPDEPYFIP